MALEPFYKQPLQQTIKIKPINSMEKNRNTIWERSTVSKENSFH